MKMGSRRVSKGEIHRSLLQDLAENLTADCFKKMKNLCKAEDYGKLGPGQLEKIKSPADLFQKLEQMAVFKEGDYRKLKRLLVLSKRKDAVRIVKAAEKELCQAGGHVEDYPCDESDSELMKSRDPLMKSTATQTPLEEQNAPRINSHESFDERVRYEAVLVLSYELGDSWKFIGRWLKLTDATLEKISKDSDGNQTEMAYQILTQWTNTNGQNATYMVLQEAFRKVKRVDLVHKLKSLKNGKLDEVTM